MSTLTIYTFYDDGGEESGTYSTPNAREAEEYARRYSLGVRANEYEWTEAIDVEGWDFRTKPTDSEGGAS